MIESDRDEEAVCRLPSLMLVKGVVDAGRVRDTEEELYLSVLSADIEADMRGTWTQEKVFDKGSVYIHVVNVERTLARTMK